jgi:hypothetical protein
MLCKCGCGAVTKLHTKTNRPQGRLKGLPNDFIHGHNKPSYKHGRRARKVRKDEEGTRIFVSSGNVS